MWTKGEGTRSKRAFNFQSYSGYVDFLHAEGRDVMAAPGESTAVSADVHSNSRKECFGYSKPLTEYNKDQSMRRL